MVLFYIFTILCSLVFSLNIKGAYRLMIIGGILALILLPDTGFDYSAYKDAYDNAFFMHQYPWFWTRSFITSEPLYLWYTSFWGVILPFEFPFYLAANFVVCLYIANYTFKFLPNDFKYYFWLMLLPVIFPTIFYWSPRSSTSFFLVLLGFVLLLEKKYWKCGLALFGGIMIHSQFILIILLIIITYFFFTRKKICLKKYPLLICIICLFLFFFLINMETFVVLIGNLLSFLPSAEVIISKMWYFESETYEGFRLTSILSIAVYPTLAIILTRYVLKHPNKYIFSDNQEINLIFTYMLLAIIMYGAIINIAFFNSTHIAGRLSRFSDYLGMSILLPTFFRTITNQNLAKLVLIIFVLITPFLYKSLYTNVNWSF